MSLEITVDHLGAVQFEIRARQHTIMCDQPEANGGFDEGVTPPELLLAALGSCAAYYAAQYLRQQKLATEGTKVRVTADKVKPPARLDHFVVTIDSPVAITDEQRAGIEQAVHQCLIHNTLLQPPSIQLVITPASASGAS